MNCILSLHRTSYHYTQHVAREDSLEKGGGPLTERDGKVRGPENLYFKL